MADVHEGSDGKAGPGTACYSTYMRQTSANNSSDQEKGNQSLQSSQAI